MKMNVFLFIILVTINIGDEMERSQDFVNKQRTTHPK